MWFMALLTAAVMVGCGSGSDSPAAPPSSAKAITAFSLAWTTGAPGSATGAIDQTLKTIKVNVPYGTDLTALVATFTTTGSSVTVNSVAQVSGTTGNDFSIPVPYKVTGADGTWATYTVIVTVSANTAKAIETFTLAASGVPSIGTVISEGTTPKTIAVTMPYGTTDLTAMIATFTTTGSSVKIGAVTQNSGAAPTNDFSAASGVSPVPVVYTVTAADNSTATYNVSVTVALSSAKTITAFSLHATSGVPASTATAITGSASPFDILVTMPNGTTDLTALVADFTATGASSVQVGATLQTSGASQNDFSAASGVTPVPVAYVVTAADASTATYNVTVTVAAGPAGPVVCTGAPNCVDLGTAANYVIFGKAGVTNVPTSATTGNVGSADAAITITGFALVADSTNVFSTSSQVTGKVYAVDYAVPTPSDVGTASTDMGNAYTAANNIKGGAACPGSGNFGGLSLAPGVYKCTRGVTIPTDVTLAGTGAATDVWVFQIAGTLDQSSGVKVLPTNGALPQNIFWAVADSVSIGTTAQMEGVILGQTDINVLAGAKANGRLLAQTLVNLVGGTNKVTQPIP